jgi:hypothetical protein
MLARSWHDESNADNRAFATDLTGLGFSNDPAVSQNGFYQVDTLAGATNSIYEYAGAPERLGDVECLERASVQDSVRTLLAPLFECVRIPGNLS